MKSMTGFGRGEAAAEGWRVTVEMSAVNRKQSDIVLHLPRNLIELENPIRQKIAERVSRGRVNVSVSIESAASTETSLSVDTAMAKAYVEGMKTLSASLGTELTLRASDLLRAPGVFSQASGDISAEVAGPLLQTAVSKALEALDTARKTEGQTLAHDLSGRLAELARLRQEIARRAPQVVTHHREQLHRRLAEAGMPLPLDDERLVKEIALFADKCAIDEELHRFESHLTHFTAALSHPEPQGRALDFLCQELHRELNTMGSKASNAEISHLVVAGKTEVEKLREQVQNAE